MKPKRIAAGKFKAGYLKIMDEVKSSGKSIIITKRSIPMPNYVLLKKQNFLFLEN